MKITADNGTTPLALSSDPKGTASVTAQGVGGNDFTWSIEQSFDGTNWQAMTDDKDESVFTGCVPKSFQPVAGFQYRVKVTDMGSATEVNFGTN